MVIQFQRLTEDKGRVIAIYHNTNNVADVVTTDALIQVDGAEPPPPEKRFGQDAELFINPQTGAMWYEYTDRPLNDGERLITAENEIADLKAQLATAQADNLTSLEALAELYEMVLPLLPA